MQSLGALNFPKRLLSSRMFYWGVCKEIEKARVLFVPSLHLGIK